MTGDLDIYKCAAQYATESLFKAEQVLQRACGSPIEIRLGLAIVALFPQMRSLWWGPHLFVTSFSDRPTLNNDRFCWLVPQFRPKFHPYDFLLHVRANNFDPIEILIECDGHDFHERTPEQAMRDRKLDRDAQSNGECLLRFTGREINRNALACATQIFEQVRRLIHISRAKRA